MQGIVQSVEGEVGDHHDQRVLARRQALGEQPVGSHRRGDDGDQLLEDRVLMRDGVGAAGGSPEIRQPHQQLDPAVGRRQRQLELGDHAIGAVGMVHLLDIGATQLEDAWLGLHGHDPRHHDVPPIAQQAPGDRADA